MFRAAVKSSWVPYMSVGSMSGIRYWHKSSSELTKVTLFEVFSSNQPFIMAQQPEKTVGALYMRHIPSLSG